ncbi:MAG: DNA-formamidopyrimidine glycosylase family protein [Rhodospirillaceae bacterium]
MPEGHTIHRAARDHQKLFAGQELIISSPQGRFRDGASRLTGNVCQSVEAIGKHLLYHFSEDKILHIHLGLFGKIRKSKVPAVDAIGAVRVRLVGRTHFIDINGPTICEIIEQPDLEKLLDRIGPDLLRNDADPEQSFNRICKSRSQIGALLMDQSVIAGIGNIYRTEILWRQSIHPKTPGTAISREIFKCLWKDAKLLLELGVKKNAIITTDKPSVAKTRYKERVNIFGKSLCPRCRGAIRKFEISKRRVFVCENCQPPIMDTKISAK